MSRQSLRGHSAPVPDVSQVQCTKVGEKIRRLREAQHWRQEDVARAIGLKVQSQISAFETGKKTPSSTQIIRLATLFGVSADYLLRDDETEQRSYVPPTD